MNWIYIYSIYGRVLWWFVSVCLVEVENLVIEKLYLILRVYKQTTVSAWVTILKLRESCDRDIYIFLPDCYKDQFDLQEISDINYKKTFYNLTYRGHCLCNGSKSALLDFTSLTHVRRSKRL